MSITSRIASLSGNTVSAKAKSMYGKRLTEDNYKDMLRRNSVSEIASYLAENTAYGESLRQVDVHSIHRGQLESLLVRDLFLKYTKLCKFNFSGNDGFYNYLVLQYEIEQILKCILSLNAGTMESFILELPAFLISRASFDLMALARVRSFGELMAVLKKTSYDEILSPFSPNGGLIDYSACEKALMTYHYDRLLSVIRSGFHGQTRKDLEKAVRINVTLLNLLTIYRLKRYFSASEEEISEVILPFSFKLSRSMLRQMIEAPNTETFFELFDRCYYGKERPEDDGTAFEHYLNETVFRFNKRLMRFSTSPPAVLYAYVLLKNTEVNNIIRIVEGIRYRVPSSQIEPMLIV